MKKTRETEHDDRPPTVHVDSVPFVDGTPTTRASSATASRNARATDLNCASTMWWGVPARDDTHVQANLR